jgi:poly(3-hydroxybutyrate) depolymerase
MIPQWQMQQKERPLASPNKITRKLIAGLWLLAALFTSSTALAGWNTQSETIADHPTWIYTPDSTLANGDKRGLMVVLHGCAQTHDQIKNGGNLEKAADDFGLVMAVPYVTKKDRYLLDCWDYDKGIEDNHGHVAEITSITKELTLRDGLNIDPDHVYVVGLSSGGALALKLGCKAPDVFAGIGAIAGPSVGSNQLLATVDGAQIPDSNIPSAIRTCRSLAAARDSYFATQIANVTYGDMDKNGPNQIIETPPCQQKHPGQNCVASIKWSEHNIKILREIYGTDQLGSKTSVQDGKGTERTAEANGETVLSLLVVHDVGHAWPAGSGKDNSDEYGQYIAQKGLNYSLYAAGWLIEHNRRSSACPTCPVLICTEPAVSGTSVTLTCSANGPNPISRYHVAVSGASPQDDVLPGAPSFTKRYDSMANGKYTVAVTATDDQGNDSNTIDLTFEIPSVSCVTADNAAHVAEGRADACKLLNLWACAKGSGDDLGLNYSFFTSSIKQTGPAYWVKVNSCPSE